MLAWSAYQSVPEEQVDPRSPALQPSPLATEETPYNPYSIPLTQATPSVIRTPSPLPLASPLISHPLARPYDPRESLEALSLPTSVSTTPLPLPTSVSASPAPSTVVRSEQAPMTPELRAGTLLIDGPLTPTRQGRTTTVTVSPVYLTIQAKTLSTLNSSVSLPTMSRTLGQSLHLSGDEDIYTDNAASSTWATAQAAAPAPAPVEGTPRAQSQPQVEREANV